MGSLNLVLNRMIEPKKGIEESKKKFSNKALIALIIPIIVEQFLALLVGIADTLMISYAGEAAVSGVSLVNQLNNIFIMIFTALATGGAIIASQYIGSKDQKKGNLAASQLVMLTTLISIVVTVLLMLFGKNVFTLVFGRVEKDVFEAGVVSLKRLLNQLILKSWSSKMIKKSLEAYFFTLKNKIVFCKNSKYVRILFRQ